MKQITLFDIILGILGFPVLILMFCVLLALSLAWFATFGVYNKITTGKVLNDF